jgi:aspartate/tyrosine/aromatic aminotransferase
VGLAHRKKQQGVKQDFSVIASQAGMFSAGIAPEVDKLKDKHSIYAVRSERINVVCMRDATMDRLCRAVAEVLA